MNFYAEFPLTLSLTHSQRETPSGSEGEDLRQIGRITDDDHDRTTDRDE